MIYESASNSHLVTPQLFKQDTITVAQKLLGTKLVYHKNGQVFEGIIVETEAYLGLEDPSCHSFHGKKTLRTQTFYLEAGHVYVYLIYGMYYCLNFITGDIQTPEAVLIRAIEPLKGIDSMQLNRKQANLKKLCNGPGKLCQALGINFSDNNQPLNKGPLELHHGQAVSKQDILSSERIGLNPLHDSAHWPLRFHIKNSPFVSRP